MTIHVDTHSQLYWRISILYRMQLLRSMYLSHVLRWTNCPADSATSPLIVRVIWFFCDLSSTLPPQWSFNLEREHFYANAMRSLLGAHCHRLKIAVKHLGMHDGAVAAPQR